MGEWMKCRLGEVADLVPGFAFKSKSFGDHYSDKVIKITNISENGISDSELTGVDLSGIDKSRLEKFKVVKGDYVLAMTGSIGKIGKVVSGEAYINQRVLTIQPHKDVDKIFLFCALRTKQFYQHMITHIDSHSVQANISAGSIGEYEFSLPPLPTQRKIAAVLGALDDKIENNRKICANLEAQAQAIFKSWFVDFEPFGGELVTDTVWGNHPTELRYVKVGSLKPVLETGSRPKGGAALSGVPSIGAENVKQLGVFDFGAKKFIPEEYAAKLNRGRINGYELLLYKDGGKPGMFKPHFSMFGDGFPYQECYINEHVFKLDFGSRATNIFAYFYFKSQYVFNWLEMNGGKAAIPGINQSNVLDVMMPDPANRIVRQLARCSSRRLRRCLIFAKNPVRLPRSATRCCRS